MEQGQADQKPKNRFGRALSWTGEHVAGTVLGFLVTAALTAGVVWISGKDKTEGQKIDQVRAEIVENGLETRSFEKVSLHAGATSYLLTVGKPGKFEADEIQIYDAEGDSLKQRFSFDPEIRSADPDVIASPETFEILGEHDVNGDGQSELIGSYTLESASAFLQIPVSIVWDQGQRRYLLRPLLQENPNLTAEDGASGPGTLKPFESPFLVATENGKQFEAWAAESVALLQKPLIYARGKPLYLGGSYPSPEQPLGQALADKKLQVAYWAIAITPGQASPHATRLCWNKDLRISEAEVDSGEREEDAIARNWSNLVREDELARRGEANDPNSLYVGFMLDGRCVLGE